VPEPITITVPAPLQCHPLTFTATGTYDGLAKTSIPPPSKSVTWTVKAKLSIPKGLGLPPAEYTGEDSKGTVSSGNWQIPFTVNAADAGSNATMTAELWSSESSQAPLASCQVANFQVQQTCPLPDDDIDPIDPIDIGAPVPLAPEAAAVAEAAAAAGAGAAPAAAALAGDARPKYRFFAGHYQAKHTRVECVIERRFIGGKREVQSGNRAEMHGGRWAVVLYIPEPFLLSEDWLMVTWYELGGKAEKRSEAKIR
jgi:hypothetical protein